MSKRYFWIIDIEPFFLLMVLALLAAVFFPRWFHSPFAVAKDAAVLVALGFLCVLGAKASLFRRALWVSWGPRQMTVWWSRLYKLGYVLMGLGILLVLAAYRSTP